MMPLTPKEEEARKRVCLPLDGLHSVKDVTDRIKELSPVVGLFKVGKGSFTRFGPDIVHLVRDYGADVFLDLKFHDIPNTVKDAAYAATELGVYMFNVHASGGYKMLNAARDGISDAFQHYGTQLRCKNKMPKVIGVTVLTSLDQTALNGELRVPGTVEEQVLNLAKLSLHAGLDGIVCSAADLLSIREHFPENFMYVTPGIEGPNVPAGSDQKRVMTPGRAIQSGSSILVVGRAITGPKTPEERLQAGYEVLKDMVPYL